MITACCSHWLSFLGKQKAPGNVAGESCCDLAGQPKPRIEPGLPNIGKESGGGSNIGKESGGGCHGALGSSGPGEFSQLQEAPWFLSLLSRASCSGQKLFLQPSAALQEELLSLCIDP